MAKKSSQRKQQAAPYSTVRNIVCIPPSQAELTSIPGHLRREVGHDLVRAQHGLNPLNGKSLKNIADKVREIRVGIHGGGNFRVVYKATNSTIYILTAFHKQNQALSTADEKRIKTQAKLVP
jgi:phage-related protein